MKKRILALACTVALLISGNSNVSVSAAKKIGLSSKKITVTEGKSKILKVKNTKKKIKWKVLSGKKYITLKKKSRVAVTIKGKNKGQAKVQAIIGKKKLTCKVVVKEMTKQNESTSNVSIQPDETSVPTGNLAEHTTAPTDTQTPPVSEPTDSARITEPPTNTRTPSTTSEPTNTPKGKDENDVAVLKALIAEQKALGAVVSEDLDDEQYEWDEEGYLMEIDWTSVSLRGDISFSGLSHLKFLYCGNGKGMGDTWNRVASLDVSKCTELETLYCDYNCLSALDVNDCVLLKHLRCENNQLSSLNMENCTELTYLDCRSWYDMTYSERNQLDSLDVSNKMKLQNLYCSGNGLTTLNVSNCISLIELDCSDNQLNSLDMTNNVNLESLSCGRNQLRHLDVSNNVNLTELYCHSNSLSLLDVTNNVNLIDLECDHNWLSSLDVSKNVNLEILACWSNQLTTLDLTNNTKLIGLDCDETVTVIGYNK